MGDDRGSFDPDRSTGATADGQVDGTDEAIAREAARARARRAAGGGAEETVPPLTRQEENDARMRRARRAAWSYSPGPRTSHHSGGGFVGGLVLHLAIALGFHLLWPVLVRWMSFRRAAGIVAGAGLGMLCGALLLPRLAFPESRATGGDMVGALLKGEVVAITLALLVIGFGGMFIALFASQARAKQAEATQAEATQTEATQAEERRERDAEAGDAAPQEAEPTRAPAKETASRRAGGPRRARSRQPLLDRALQIADPVAVALTWFFLATLLTGQFFFDPGITVRSYVAGENPPSYFSQPMVGSLIFGVVLAIPVTLVLGASASKVSSPAPGGRPAGG